MARSRAIRLFLLGGLFATIVVLASILALRSVFRSDDDPRLRLAWWRYSSDSLMEVRTALGCFERRTGGYPDDSKSLFDSGCLSRGVAYFRRVPDQLYASPLFGNPEWEDLDGVLLRRGPLGGVEGDTIVAVTVPPASESKVTMVLSLDGNIEMVYWEEWQRNRDSWRRRVGDELWRDSPEIDSQK